MSQWQPPPGDPGTWSLDTLRQQGDELQKGCEELPREMSQWQPPPGDPGTWSLDTLRQQVDELQKGCEELQMESEMLADFLQRNAEQGDEDHIGHGRGSQGKISRKAGLPSTLTVDEKCRIANMEVEELHKDIDMTKKTSEQNLDILKALLE